MQCKEIDNVLGEFGSWMKYLETTSHVTGDIKKIPVSIKIPSTFLNTGLFQEKLYKLQLHDGLTVRIRKNIAIEIWLSCPESWWLKVRKRCIYCPSKTIDYDASYMQIDRRKETRILHKKVHERNASKEISQFHRIETSYNFIRTPGLYFGDREANLLNSCINWTGFSFSYRKAYNITKRRRSMSDTLSLFRRFVTACKSTWRESRDLVQAIESCNHKTLALTIFSQSSSLSHWAQRYCIWFQYMIITKNTKSIWKKLQQVATVYHTFIMCLFFMNKWI